MVTHGPLLSRTSWMRRAYPIGPDDVVSCKTQFIFGVSEWELFYTLTSGAQLALVPQSIVASPDALARSIVAHRAAVSSSSPPTSTPNRAARAARCIPQRRRRRVASGGDGLAAAGAAAARAAAGSRSATSSAVARRCGQRSFGASTRSSPPRRAACSAAQSTTLWGLASRWCTPRPTRAQRTPSTLPLCVLPRSLTLRFPRSRARALQRLHNLYGPTEGSMTERCTDPYPTEVLIGTPIDDTVVVLLDGLLRPAPVGMPAEICFGGAIAAGYLARRDLTSAKFVPNPLADEMGAGGRVPACPLLYLSGDLAMRLPSGNLRFLGRVDRQVKVRGFRIERGRRDRRALLLGGGTRWRVECASRAARCGGYQGRRRARPLRLEDCGGADQRRSA